MSHNNIIFNNKFWKSMRCIKFILDHTRLLLPPIFHPQYWNSKTYYLRKMVRNGGYPNQIYWFQKTYTIPKTCIFCIFWSREKDIQYHVKNLSVISYTISQKQKKCSFYVQIILLLLHFVFYLYFWMEIDHLSINR